MNTYPELIEPASGSHIDGLAPTFNWGATLKAENYELQISEAETFDVPLIDVSVSDATSLTLYEVLPTDGRQLFWRVRASNSSGQSVWSDTVGFVSGRESRSVRRRGSSRQAAQAAVSKGPARVDAPLYATGTTSSREAYVMAVVLLVTILIVAIGILI